MRIIARKTIRQYWETCPGADQPALERALKAWYREAKRARWTTSSDVKRKYGSASILKNNRVVFNICGNRFRLVARVNYSVGIVYIKWVGSHGDYDDIDAEVV